MNSMFLKLYIKSQELANREDGQDLVEYSMIVAVLALGATAGMVALANGLNSAFQGLSASLGSYVSQ